MTSYVNAPIYCMQDTFAHALGQAGVTIGYFVYNVMSQYEISFSLKACQESILTLRHEE